MSNNKTYISLHGKLYNVDKTKILDIGVHSNSISPIIGSFKNLEYLRVRSGGLTEIPNSIGNLKKLKVLVLQINRLTKLPESIGDLESLEILNMHGNTLNELPESIGKLKKLRELDLTENQLTKLPTSILNLTNLEKLEVGENRNLAHLPGNIGRLEKLEHLDVSRTKLKTFPESIGNLKNLAFLDLTGITLTKLPTSFRLLNPDLDIWYGGRNFNTMGFVSLFSPKRKRNFPKRVSTNTELVNKNLVTTTKISNIPKNKRVYMNINSNVKNTGELRRIYNRTGVNRYMRGRSYGRLFGGNFVSANITRLNNNNTVNKNVYLRNIKNRLRNVSLNNFNSTVNKIKSNLPTNVSRTDVNNQIRLLKPEILKKILNKLKNSPPDSRNRIMRAMKRQGLMNQSNIDTMKKNL